MNSDKSRRLSARIKNNQVILHIADGDMARFTEAKDLVAATGEAQEVTLVVRDFFANGTVYRAFGLVLGDDSSVERYWQPATSDTGVQCTLSVSALGAASAIVVGARPDNPAAPTPVPFDSRAGARGGGLPGTGSGGGGGAGDDGSGTSGG